MIHPDIMSFIHEMVPVAGLVAGLTLLVLSLTLLGKEIEKIDRDPPEE